MTKHLNTLVYITQKNDYANQNAVFQEFVTKLKKSGMFVFLIQWCSDILSKIDEFTYFFRDKEG